MTESDPGMEWFDARTAGAPPALRDRARHFVDAAPRSIIAVRLAQAGGSALDAATRGGADRSAALDLLAADALITLALLATAEREPEHLETIAAGLRATAGAVA